MKKEEQKMLIETLIFSFYCWVFIWHSNHVNEIFCAYDNALCCGTAMLSLLERKIIAINSYNVGFFSYRF